jgi:hypothetical protein
VWLTGIALLAMLLPPGVRAASQASPAAIRSVAPATPAVGQVTAHDGKFWLGGQPITLEGTNVGFNCCSSSVFDRLRSWGMNFIRLHYQWSRLEPDPPVNNGDGTWTHTYDTDYLELIAAEVARAQRSGLYVMISSHGCDCSTFAYPAWQYQSPYNSHGLTYTPTPVGFAQAATDFWDDALRQQFMIDALTTLASRLASVGGVVGYEMLNEPNPGFLPNRAETTATILDWQLRAGQAVRAADPPRVVFFTTRFGYAPGLPAADLSGFVQLGNVAFDVHNYFGARWGTRLLEDPAEASYEESLQPMFNHVLTEDGEPPYAYIGTTYGQVRFLQDVLDSLEPWGIPLVVGEFGIRDASGVYLYFGSLTAALTHLDVSWAGSTFDSPLGFVNADGTLDPWAAILIGAADQ